MILGVSAFVPLVLALEAADWLPGIVTLAACVVLSVVVASLMLSAVF